MDPHVVVVAVIVTIALFNFAMSNIEVCWRLYGRRTPEAMELMKFPLPITADEARLTFTIIVPALHEAAVLQKTLEQLAQQTHPDVEIIVTLRSDDLETIWVAEAAAANNPRRIVIVDETYEHPNQNKPSQLNAALAKRDSDYIGVFDAEDDVAPDLLLHVEALILQEKADVVQGGVQLMNLGDNLRQWFCVHNVLEYFFWFTSRMFFQVRWGFVPLGGNTVFVRRELLVEAGGWPINLTEDCALGVLLCTKYGAKVVAAYDPALVTKEETPPRVWGKGGLVKQRTRWDQGFLSVLMEGRWRKLPTLRQRFLAWYILSTPFIQALSGLMLPLALFTFFVLKAPVGVVMLMYLPFIPIAVTQVLQVIGLREFGQLYGQKVRLRHYVSLIFTSYLYQIVLMVAALIAVARYVTGRTNWDRTHHTNLHRDEKIVPVQTIRVSEEDTREPDVAL